MRVGALIQARMSSTRCPGKVLRSVAGQPLLGHLLLRLSAVQGVDVVAVATSREREDDAIADYCAGRGVRCHRGDLADVAGRLMEVAGDLGLDGFVRVCGDSPLLDPALVRDAVALFRTQGADFVTNCLPKRFPAGQSVEVVAMSALRRAYADFGDDACHEHVTRYFYEHQRLFSVWRLGTDVDYSGVHLAVDTEEDFTLMARLMEGPAGDGILPIDELARLYREVVAAADRVAW